MMDRRERNRLFELFFHQISEAAQHFNQRSIAIWGTRERGEIAKQVVEALDYTCSAFVSSRPKTDLYCGLPVITPNQLKPEEHYVIQSTEAREVYFMLKDMGYSGENCADFVWCGKWHDDMEYEGCLIGRGTYGYGEFGPQPLGCYVSKIGRYTSINTSASVVVNHMMSGVSTYPILDSLACTPPITKVRSITERFLRDIKLVTVGNDVWIGANVTILPGVQGRRRRNHWRGCSCHKGRRTVCRCRRRAGKGD